MVTRPVEYLNQNEYLWSCRTGLENLRISANGKGITKEQATASAFAELAERVSAQYEIQLAPHRKVFGHNYDMYEMVELCKYMPGYIWAHQDSLPNPLTVESLLRNHQFTKGQFEYLKLHSELARHWVTGTSLVTGEELQIPILLVKWINSTNGIASGNTMEEAIIHASCEIFERHALIKYLRGADVIEEVNVSPIGIEDDRIKSILSFFNKNDQQVMIKYIGRDIYPVFAIMTFSNELESNKLGFNQIKAGCAFNSTEALLRCFTERMQGTTFEAEAQLGDMPQDSPEKFFQMFFQGVCPTNLWPRRAGKVVDFEHVTMDGTAVEFDACVDIARRLGTDIVFIDHTHPILDFPTCRIVMPGVSDFIDWWNPQKATLDLIGNLSEEDDTYERELFKLLKTFGSHRSNAHEARNYSRRDA